MNRNKQIGFTIIELLVVVVIIAILATITILSYSGIQDRAVHSKYAVSGRQWAQQLMLNNVFELPIQAPQNQNSILYSCLGESIAVYPKTDDFVEGSCVSIGGEQMIGGYFIAGYNAEMAALLNAEGNVPSAKDLKTFTFQIPDGNGGTAEMKTRGILFTILSEFPNNVEKRSAILTWFVKKSIGCGAATINDPAYNLGLAVPMNNSGYRCTMLIASTTPS